MVLRTEFSSLLLLLNGAANGRIRLGNKGYMELRVSVLMSGPMSMAFDLSSFNLISDSAILMTDKEGLWSMDCWSLERTLFDSSVILIGSGLYSVTQILLLMESSLSDSVSGTMSVS